jgi:hypothetical protein
MTMRSLKFVTALALTLLLGVPAGSIAQQAVVTDVESISGVGPSVTTVACVLVKYRGTTAGKPTVEAAAGGDVTFKIAGAADTTTGWDTAASANGIFDLSSPDATIDTVGEFVNLVNTLGSNWVAVLSSCLASDLTNNAILTLSATDAAGPKGVGLIRDATVVSATSVFTAQILLTPASAVNNIAWFLSGSPVGSPSGTAKVNPNPFEKHQTFVQHIRENITSSGTVAQFEILGVLRTYDSLGKVSEVVRVLYTQLGAATTVEAFQNFHAGPIVTNRGEMVVVRQSTGTALTVLSINGNGYAVTH